MLGVSLSTSHPCLAASDGSDEENQELSPDKWQQVYSIIDEIKGENTSQRFKVALRTGLVQLSSNTPDSLKLNGNNSILAAGIAASLLLANQWGLDASFLYGANALASGTSPNSAANTVSWLDIGPRYIIYLSQARSGNYLAFKVYYHRNDSNFNLVSDGSVPNPMYMNHYGAFAVGAERNIPISSSFGVMASFSLMQIIQASSPSVLGFNKSGYGFDLLGELYYQFSLLSKTSRISLSYWQQGMQNDFDNTAKNLTSRNSYLQSSRSVLANLTFLF